MKRIKKCIFIQNCGIFQNEILVSVNGTFEDIYKYARKNGDKFFYDAVEKNKNLIISLQNNAGFVIQKDEFKGTGILWLREYSNRWGNIEILLHEIFHIVDFVSEQKTFRNELEARAFLFEYLFREIRRKIQSHLKIK